MQLKAIYNLCFKDIGGSENKDILWYRLERPKKISRSSFFESAVFAIWVSGLKRKSANSFLERAEQNGFNWDYEATAEQTDKQWNEFKVQLHGKHIPARAGMKWDAIRNIAMQLNEYENDTKFKKEWFNGKSLSSKLGNTDVGYIQKLKLPFIGRANAHFIVRNMGGEAIKCDRWLEAFMNYFKITESRLLTSLEEASIPAGLFDLVIWAYCEMHIKKTSEFNNHFEQILYRKQPPTKRVSRSAR